MRIKLSILSAAAIFLSVVFCLLLLGGYRQTDYSSPSVKIRNTEIPVELARTDEQMQKGLSGRPSLESERGMLFIFKEPGIYTFWMPDMHFPIDIIWINGGRVVGVTPNVPNDPPPDKPLPLYAPPKPVQYVLEVNAGFAEKHGVMAGDEVIFKGI